MDDLHAWASALPAGRKATSIVKIFHVPGQILTLQHIAQTQGQMSRDPCWNGLLMFRVIRMKYAYKAAVTKQSLNTCGRSNA